MLVRWLLRERWAGELLLARKFKTRSRLVLLAMVLGLPDILFSDKLILLDVLTASLLAAGILHLKLVLPYVEIRDRGIVFEGSLVSWLNMEGYSWEGEWNGKPPSEWCPLPDGTDCLRLSVRRRLSFLKPYVRIPVRREDVAIVDSLLKKYLSTVAMGSEAAPFHETGTTRG